MSLPNYLAKIKSSGVYRFVWDKSALPPQAAETMRLVVGYSEKGPFNTPVYVENVADFTTIYGNISKRLERRGVYFHRLAEQALAAGPILALNIKPFSNETVGYAAFDASDINGVTVKQTPVTTVYDTNKFWVLDADQLPSKVSDKKFIYVTSTDTKENSCSIFMRPTKPASYENISIRQWYVSQAIEMPEYLVPIQDNDISDYFVEVFVFRGEFTNGVCGNNGVLSKYFVEKKNDDDETYYAINPELKNIFDEDDDALQRLAEDSNSNFVSSYVGCMLPYFKDANGSYVSIDIKFNADNSKHKMLMKLNESYLESVLEESGAEDLIKVLNPNSSQYDDIVPVYLSGYNYLSITKKDEAAAIQQKIFGFGGFEEGVNVQGTLKSKGLRSALTNRVDVEYHYIIDTFDTLIGEAAKYKSTLANIAKEKDNAFAILNFPKMSHFTSVESYKTNGTLDISKVVKGEKAPFTLPGESEGASYCAYYTQLVFSDGTLKSVIPSSAIVSNNFMEKWSSRQPYYIVAGPTYGTLSYSGMVGPDYNFSRSDLDILEPFGINAIIYVPRKGTYINSNQTAKQVPVSALSKIHIRELVIYLQNEIESLLQSYQWELNTQALRDTIKSKADTILDTIMNNGGVYAYKNICDATNNTPEIIDNEMIVLDTEIEPARGAGKMVHQLTIHKTGGMTSSAK